MRFSRPSKKVNQCNFIRVGGSTLVNHCNDIQVIKMRWTDWQCSQRPSLEWMSEDGSRCMKLQRKRVERSLRLSSQVIQTKSVTMESVGF